MLILLYDKVEVMNPLSRFINDLMQDIWKNESVRFKKLYEYYMNMPEKQITALLESNKALVYENDGNNMTSLITCGCQHFYSNFSKLIYFLNKNFSRTKLSITTSITFNAFANFLFAKTRNLRYNDNV